MDDVRFDALARALGTLVDRRAMARALVGRAVSVLGLSSSHDAGAKKKKKCKKPKVKCGKTCCARGLFCNAGRCSANPCFAGNSGCLGNDADVLQCRFPDLESCFCFGLMEGGFAFAYGIEECPDASECSTNAECASGEVCVKLADPEFCCPDGGLVGLCRPSCSYELACTET